VSVLAKTASFVRGSFRSSPDKIRWRPPGIEPGQRENCRPLSPYFVRGTFLRGADAGIVTGSPPG
jgi:hypothetical protein